MTTGRINQVATIRFMFENFLQKVPNTRFASLCGIWIASLHQFRNCLVPLLRSSVRVGPGQGTTPLEKRAQLHQRHEIQSLFGTPPNCASWCVGLLLYRWLNKPLIHTTPKQEYRSSGVRTRSTRCKSKKKQKRSRSFANEKLACCHLETRRPGN